jgi:hypothetical protein
VSFYVCFICFYPLPALSSSFPLVLFLYARGPSCASHISLSASRFYLAGTIALPFRVAHALPATLIAYVRTSVLTMQLLPFVLLQYR